MIPVNRGRCFGGGREGDDRVRARANSGRAYAGQRAADDERSSVRGDALRSSLGHRRSPAKRH